MSNEKKQIRPLNIVVPAVLDWDWHTPDEIVAELSEQQAAFGINRFILAFPSKGYRSAEFPTMEYVERYARNFKKVRERVAPLGIECGWWFCGSIKLGHGEGFTRVVTQHGEEVFYSTCPLDTAFRQRLCDYVMTFVEIARPAFLFMEDDFSMHASAAGYGCFCEHHLEAFARKTGRKYTREELVGLLAQRTDESLALLREWRELMKESLVLLATDIRRAVDAVDPDIPIGAMESSCSDQDGNCAYAVAKALAGDRHTPYSRLCGAMYNGVRVPEIPKQLFHPIYTKQHITEDFDYFFEGDCFPHTRFFTSGKEMQAMLAAVYAAGFDGTTLQTQQCLDDANEDKAFGAAFAKERPRHEALHQVAKWCELKGVEITFDPFYNTLSAKNKLPDWAQTAGLMGIPYTTLPADVAMWDDRPATYYPHERVLEYLSKTLFLDGDAAKALCRRGYGEYLGVEIGEDVATAPFKYDCCAREIICDGYAPTSRGRNMAIPHLYSAGHSGKLLRMTVTDAKTEVLTEAYTFQRELICPAMTRFRNKLGGTVVVMGMTLEKNFSQSLFNYRRQKLLQQMICDAADEFVLVKDAPRVFALMNEPKDEARAEMLGLLTLINLAGDGAEFLSLHLPPKWRKYREILSMDATGAWCPAAFEATEDGILLTEGTDYLHPVHLLFR
ncbi:MAG: hypothetical protein E7644_04295 [Ruminococcaceae bacterium]|nr:hypothetical protein [Oscillospiraceae bacterium]